jgi:hypothetical protein
MRAEEVIELVRRRPFAPLRVYMIDGTSHEILDPDLVIVSRSQIDIGVPSRRPGIARRVVFCHLPNVLRIDVFDGTYPPPIN